MVNENHLQRLSLRLLAAIPANLGWAKRKRHADDALKGIRRDFATRGTPISADLVDIAWTAPQGPLAWILKPVPAV